MIIDKKLKFFIICTAVVAISLLYFFVDARGTTILPRCPFNVLTGLYCPGCGSQRAVSALLHFDFASAIRYNILLVVSLPIIVYSGYARIMNTFTSIRIKQKLFYSVTFIKVVAVVVFIFWILRNISSYPFNLLAPHHL